MSEKWEWKISNHLSIQVSNIYVCRLSLVVTSIYVHMHPNGFREYFSFSWYHFHCLLSLSLLVNCLIEVWKRIWLSFRFFSYHFSLSFDFKYMKKFNALSFLFGFFSPVIIWWRQLIYHSTLQSKEWEKEIWIYDMRLKDVEIHRIVFLRWIAFDR